ncbi:MAG: TIGR00341 family protein [Bacteroidales bacterium]|nr:TIGR00341 family protein [Bacteroidales bacterium]MDY5449034.1 TIGR00341 family protein [Prevotella sp.]
MEENKNIISDDNPVNNQSQPVTDNGSNTENDVHRKFSFKEFFRELWKRLKELVNIADDTDIAATVNNISKGVEFKGDNVWVLFFAIVIASVGLNVNSTAVIIGAMLVSPLMGPIMGIGLSIGIYDVTLLRKSLKNLLLMVVISLLASSLYFLVTPLSEAQSELLARTNPTIFDVFIALFGGLAGILAQSRKQEKITIVSGVAIATALMPPLCTAGYGIGTGQLRYFFGAFYLFFINSFFIALATFLMVRYLKFPKKKFINPVKEKRVKRYIFVFSVIVLVPSIFLAVDVIKQASFNSSAIQYVNDISKNVVMDGVHIVSSNKVYNKKGSEIQLSLVGKSLTNEQVAVLQQRLADFGLKDTKLVIKQAFGGELDVKTQAAMLQDFIESKEHQISERDSIIQVLENKLSKVNNNLPVKQIVSEAKVLYPDINELMFATAVKYNSHTNKVDTLPIVNVSWKSEYNDSLSQAVTQWLSVRLEQPKLTLIKVE